MRVVDLLFEAQLPHLAQQVPRLDSLHLFRVAPGDEASPGAALPKLLGRVQEMFRLPRPEKARLVHPEHNLRFPPCGMRIISPATTTMGGLPFALCRANLEAGFAFSKLSRVRAGLSVARDNSRAAFPV